MLLPHQPARGSILSVLRLFGAALAILALTSVLGLTAAQAKPVAASIVVDAETGEVLSRSNADAQTYPASLTKMMTLYLLFDALDKGTIKLTDRITFSKNAASEAATNMNVQAGDTINVETAILAMVVRSANDVSTAVGERLGGTETAFARMMTAKARQLGMNNTTYRNANGLPNPGQVTTARDQATLGVALLRDHPKYYGYFGRNSFVYRGNTYGGHNRVMKKFAGADGIKTGYIRAAGFNLVSSAERNGRRLVGVVLGGASAPIRDKQMVALLTDGFKTRQGIGDVLIAKAPGSAGPAQLTPTVAANSNVADDGADETDMDAVVASALVPTPKPTRQDDSIGTAIATMASVSLAPAVAASPDSQSVANVWSSDKNQFGIQVGAYSKFKPAQKAAERATKAVPALLADARIVIDRGNSDIYRARVFGLSKTDADAACKKLKAKQTDCLVVKADSSVAQTLQ
ncbi:D-alanyl-D-alanine carboxypeptidase [Dongia rigui]|uniref:D-alanyl-D-alanine carboxypeptidase n=1 Tax=Dongia rigui TaxID=940149 RepID=A0ABU5E0G3_9PROT|nr:D-alanyl-D-alanine carboxypeptidase [Dongia rigui]MDY0872979.1 D-alanyl-D-alanine carboxypeptidase [Dongia rigui]